MQRKRRILPTLDFLKGFEAAARHLSFTKAASELFVTQSAVSRQIQSLEEQLGVSLFQRRPKDLVLTEAGETLYRAASEVLRQVREAIERLDAGGRPEALTVTCTVAFASLWLIPRLSAFRRSGRGPMCASPPTIACSTWSVSAWTWPFGFPHQAGPGSRDPAVWRGDLSGVRTRAATRSRKAAEAAGGSGHHVLLHLESPAASGLS
jgi:DNA-binding transcriptional ArsR family regulator